MKRGKDSRRNDGRQAFFISAKPKKGARQGKSIATIWANKRDDGSEFYSISWFTRDRDGEETGPHKVNPERYWYNVVPIDPVEDDDEDESDEDDEEEERPAKKAPAKAATKGKPAKKRGADDDLLDGLEDEDEDDDE